MKKIYTLLFAVVFASVTVSASEGGVISNANKNNIRYIKNIKRLPDVSYQQELRESSVWKNFISTNGTWYVVFNEENAKPHRAFGTPIDAYGITPQAKAMDFINSKLTNYSIPISELVFTGSSVTEKYNYTHFHQVHNGMKVLFSDLYVKLTNSGKVITFGCDVYNNIVVPSSPTISSADAITFAQTGITDNVIHTSVNNDLFILPIPEFKQNIFKIVYEVTIETLDNVGVPARYLTWVNAETGAVLYRENQIQHFNPTPTPPAPAASATDIYISGTLFPTNPYDLTAVKPLRNLLMTEGANSYNTDSLGYIGLTSTSATTVNFSLEGLWSTVFTGTTTPSFTATANPGTNNYSFDTHANIRELSAYYHVNIVHDYMKTKFPTFTGMDNSLPTNIDVTGTCNAFYDGSSINFYAQGGGCNSMAQIGDVVYHEYGHGINDKYYNSLGGNFGNGAMGEGYADTWAMGITENAVLGIGMDDVDPTVFVRRYDINRKVYPQDLVGEVHADGEIICGAWWDTGINFGNHQQVMTLFSETFNALITGPSGTEGQLYVDVLIEALTDDDVPANGGDNNITNGTPNDLDIVNGFALHGITLLSNAVVTHTAVMASTPYTGIPINATVSVTYPWALQAAKVFYKINRLGVWNNLSMTNTGGINYTATIPSQPQGTVIGYYIGLEGTTGVLSAVQPIAANDSLPNIPYFILNGADLISEEDFDANFGSWVAGVPSDNATTGVWTIDAPIGSFYAITDPTTFVQVASQHTVSGTNCAVTGNTAMTDALGTNDVDGGETTLESPVYNLSSYTNPIFTYYRSYINNPPTGANPGNDTWEVRISNDGTNWVKVERTSVSDKTWRRFAFRVTDYIPLSSTVTVRFVAEDSLIPGAYLNGGSLVEAAIDDMYLYEESTSGIDEETAVTAVNVYPSPAHGNVTVSFELLKNSTVEIELYNAIGKKVYSETKNNSIGKQQLKINTEQFAEGLYMLNIKTEKQNYTKKVLVAK